MATRDEREWTREDLARLIDTLCAGVFAVIQWNADHPELAVRCDCIRFMHEAIGQIRSVLYTLETLHETAESA